MTMRLIEGFDYLPNTGANTLLSARGWYFLPFVTGSVAAFTAATGRFGFGKALTLAEQVVFNASPGPTLYKPFGSTPTQGVIGAAFTVGANHSGYGGIQFFDATNGQPQIHVAFRPGGIVQLWRGWAQSGTLLGQSSPGVFRDEAEFYAEAKATIDPVAGAVEVRINTVVVLSLVSQNTQATSLVRFDAVGFGGPAASSGVTNFESWSIDDVYFNDTAGSINNGYLGNVRVQTQFTAGAGASAQFTPNGAPTNWQAAHNLSVDDTVYDASGTVGAEDLYAMQAIVNGPLVHAVQFSGFYRQDDATQVTAANTYRPSTTTHVLPSRQVNQTYTSYEDIVEVNPDTGIQWTGAQMNATQMGPQVVAIA